MSDARLMLHLNGTDAATATVDATGRHPTITFAGTAAISTGSVKLGNANLLLDGNSDYLSIPNSEDFYIISTAEEDWTIDLLVKHTDHVGQEIYLSQYQDSANWLNLYHTHGFGVRFEVKSGGVTIIDTGYGGEVTDTDWHHVALCRVGNEYGIYLDGVQGAYVQDSSVQTLAGSLYVGADGAPGNYFDGRIDELRIDKSNHFSAAPNVGTTDRIVVLHSVAHYKMDDDAANTTVADSSGNGYTGTLAGGDDTEDINIVGQVDGALVVNGSDDYIDTGDTFQTTFGKSFSIAICLKPDDGMPGASEYVFGTTDITNAPSSLVRVYITTAGKVRCGYISEGNGGNEAMTNAAVFANGAAADWTLVVCVFDSTIGGVGGKKLYIDGTLATLDAAADGDTSGVTFGDYASVQEAFMGAWNNDGSDDDHYAGGIDEVILFSKALTAAEVAALNAAIVAGKPGADQEYEAYELLPEFPTLTRSPQARSWSEQMDADAVNHSGLASGFPLVAEQYTFAPELFKHVLDGLTAADKVTFGAFYLAYKGRTFLWLNVVDSLKYQVQFTRPPKRQMLSPGLWHIDMELIQVSSQTVS